MDKVIIRKAKSGRKKYTLTVKDTDKNLIELLEYIKGIGNAGHSFEILVDPDDKDYTKSFGWDGDGSDKIFDIKEEDCEDK